VARPLLLTHANYIWKRQSPLIASVPVDSPFDDRYPKHLPLLLPARGEKVPEGRMRGALAFPHSNCDNPIAPADPFGFEQSPARIAAEQWTVRASHIGTSRTR
jgi:hypothetical protein